MENKRPLKTIYTCFPDGKHKVLTMSYDDGQEFDRRLIAIFNQNGIKGTFHLNSGLMNSDERRIKLEDVKELYKGHEVSCHTSTHPTIERCPLEQVVQQVIEDRKALEDATGYPVRGMSYPNGSYSKDIINFCLRAALNIAVLSEIQTTLHSPTTISNGHLPVITVTTLWKMPVVLLI